MVALIWSPKIYNSSNFYKALLLLTFLSGGKDSMTTPPPKVPVTTKVQFLPQFKHRNQWVYWAYFQSLCKWSLTIVCVTLTQLHWKVSAYHEWWLHQSHIDGSSSLFQPIYNLALSWDHSCKWLEEVAEYTRDNLMTFPSSSFHEGVS